MTIIDECAQMSAKEKKDWLADRYFKLERDDDLAEHLTDLLETDASGIITGDPIRDPLNGETNGLMLIGESGAGKSTLLRRTLARNPSLTLFTPETPGNTLFVTVEPEATIKSLAITIAELTGYPKMNARVRGYEAWSVALHRMRTFGITLLVIDEAHQLLRKGSGREPAGVIQSLKNLLQYEGSVAVIIAGTAALRDGISVDPETDRRFVKFQPWRIMDKSLDAVRFARCVASCAEKLGLSLLPELHFPERVLFAEAGDAGRSLKLAKQTMRRALTKGRSDIVLMDAAYCFDSLYGEREFSPFDEVDWPNLRLALEDMGWARSQC